MDSGTLGLCETQEGSYRVRAPDGRTTPACWYNCTSKSWHLSSRRSAAAARAGSGPVVQPGGAILVKLWQACSESMFFYDTPQWKSSALIAASPHSRAKIRLKPERTASTTPKLTARNRLKSQGRAPPPPPAQKVNPLFQQVFHRVLWRRSQS